MFRKHSAGRTRRGPVALLVVLAVQFVSATTAFAQDGVAPEPGYGAGWLTGDHWSIDAAARLASLGLAPVGLDLSRRTRTEQELARLFSHAVAVAEEEGLGADIIDLAADFRDRFRAEFATAAAQPAALRLVHGSAARAGFGLAEGRIETGWGYWFGYPNGVGWNPPESVADHQGVTGALELRVDPHERVSLRATPAWGEDAFRLIDAYVAAEVGPVLGWAGRRRVGYGPGDSNGLVLSDSRLDGFGLQSARPFRLPWILRHAGSVTVDVSFSSMDLEHSFDDVVFLANRATLSPHRRVQLGLTRAAMFGGEGNTSVDWFDVFSMLIGKHAGERASELDNQIVALDASWTPPLERWLPLRLWLVWGFEDSAGAWQDVPGILAGVETPAVPGLPQLALSLEHASLSHSCCGNPIWYRHSVFNGGWTLDGRPLGHPLGGQGREWRVGARLALSDADLILKGHVMLRDRGEETLYAPDRIGESIAAAGSIGWLLGARSELLLDGFMESGEDWREVGANVAFRVTI